MVAAGGNSGDESSDSGEGPVEGVPIIIQCSDGSKFTVRTGLESTVEEFKVVIAKNCDVPAKQQRLIYNGRILKDDQTLANNGLQEEHAVHMVHSSVSNASTNATSNANSGDLEASSFPGLGVDELGQSGASEFRVELPQFEQQTLDEILLSTPFLQNDPNLVRMMSNPQMHEIIDQNPQFARTLNIYRRLQLTMEIASNLELMREMMQSYGRAMSNVVTPVARETGNNSVLNPFADLFRSHGRGQLHDQLTTIPATGSATTTAAAASGSSTLNTNPLLWTQSTGAYPTRAATGSATSDMLNPSQLSHISGNPMQSFLSNQDLTNQRLHGMLDFDPRLSERMSNPEFLNQLTSPENLQFDHSLPKKIVDQELASEQYVSSLLAEQQSTLGQYRATGATGNQNIVAVDSLVDLFDALASVIGISSNITSVPLDQLYASQLSQLQEMGFIETAENIQALRATAGNIHAAVERIRRNSSR